MQAREDARCRLDALRWALESHWEAPYRWGEIWTKRGRQAHFDRWVNVRAQRVRAALTKRGLTSPGNWPDSYLVSLSEVILDNCYELEGFQPKSTQVVVDAGCALGDFTILSAGSGAIVHSFDPNPENVERTKEFLLANGLSAEVEPVALGGKNGTMRLGRLNPVMFSVHAPEGGQEIPVRTLDSFNLPDVGLMKIDVEGMEAEVLVGADSLVRRCKPRIIVEVHGQKAASDVSQLLLHQSYVLIQSGAKKRSGTFGFTRDEFWAPQGAYQS
jgi:FkbM family methyltransferase